MTIIKIWEDLDDCLMEKAVKDRWGGYVEQQMNDGTGQKTIMTIMVMEAVVNHSEMGLHIEKW